MSKKKLKVKLGILKKVTEYLKEIFKSNNPQATYPLLTKEVVKNTLKYMSVAFSAKKGLTLTFIFDMDSIYMERGNLVAARSSVSYKNSYSVLFYVDTIFAGFLGVMNTEALATTPEVMEKLQKYVTQIIADQLFSIASYPNNTPPTEGENHVN